MNSVQMQVTQLADTHPLAVLARLSSRPIPRVARVARVARDLGLDPVFCGAYRSEGLPEKDEWQGVSIVRIGRHFPLLNGRHPWLYVRSVLRYNLELYRFLRRRKPAVVHASDIETMPACALYRSLHRTRLVYNIHDNVAQRYNIWAGIRAALNAVEGLCVLRSDVTIVPEEFRREALPRWCRKKVHIVRNTPGNVAYHPPPEPVDGRVRIFFGGWLDWGRGLRALLRLAEDCPRVELRIAGEGSDDIVAELRRHPRVTYLGFLDHDAVLEETRNCHFVPALYDPARTINRFAASNKLAEALAIGRPVLINLEMEIARSLQSRSFAIAVPYDKAHELRSAVEALSEDWQAYQAASIAARRHFEAYYAWEPVRAATASALDPTA